MDPLPPELDAEDQDGDSQACYEQQHQDPGHIPAHGRGTLGRRSIHGGCNKGKTRVIRRKAARSLSLHPKERLSSLVWPALSKENFISFLTAPLCPFVPEPTSQHQWRMAVSPGPHMDNKLQNRPPAITAIFPYTLHGNLSFQKNMKCLPCIHSFTHPFLSHLLSACMPGTILSAAHIEGNKTLLLPIIWPLLTEIMAICSSHLSCNGLFYIQ